MGETALREQPAIMAHVALTIRGRRIEMDMGIPPGDRRPSEMLPLFRSVAEAMIDMSVGEEREAGRKVSCRKGCGACCRQLVPISAIEAREIAKVIDRMPPARKQAILARFAAARKKLAEAEMLDPLRHPDQFTDEHMRLLGREYFSLAIACPFLEDEACSIYADRPITCREYLVTSPSEYCADPTAETVSMVPLPAGPVWTSVARLEQERGSRFIRWVPLILALEFASRAQPEPPARPGTEWAQEFFRRFAREVKDV